MSWFYAEQLSMGKWRPVLFAERPITSTQGGVLRVGAAGTGPQIRRIKRVAPGETGLSLAALERIYGNDDPEEDQK